MVCHVAAVFLFLLVFPSASIAGTFLQTSGLQLTVTDQGDYTLTTVKNPWTFSGSLGAPIDALDVASGADSIGPWHEARIQYTTSTAREARIRLYDARDVVLFTAIAREDTTNDLNFPALSTYPSGMTDLSYQGMFAKQVYNSYNSDSPWVFFDPDGRTFIFSPASNFMIASNRRDGSTLTTGIASAIASLPSGFTHQTMLVIGDGINRTFDAWGHALTDLYGKQRPTQDSDAMLRNFGYWTDNGGTYYYNNERGLDYEATLTAVRDDFNLKNITLGYMQLDSWFYPKGASQDWKAYTKGIYEYVAAPAIFPDGLPAFQKNLGLPLIAHARWIDSSSPYQQQYRMSGGVSVDPAYWSSVAQYLKSSGVTTYEQDWLGLNAIPLTNLNDGEDFMTLMANSMAAQGITMQYCMPDPRHFLQGAKYSNLTTIRTSQDAFGPSRWSEFLHASRLASALGEFPWSDVSSSGDRESLLISTLSAGPVGVGDKIGSIDNRNLAYALRPDGLIIKPDSPIVPLDATYLAESADATAPMVASTASWFKGIHVSYVLAFPQGGGTNISFTPASLNHFGPVYVYDFFAASGRVVPKGSAYNDAIIGALSYYIESPIGPSGVALLGELDHFVSASHHLFAAITDDGVLAVRVRFIEGETTHTISGYSPVFPILNVSEGKLLSKTWNPASKLFRVTIAPDSANFATVNFTTDPNQLLPSSVGVPLWDPSKCVQASGACTTGNDKDPAY